MDIQDECNNLKRQTHKKLTANRVSHLEGTLAAARSGVEGYWDQEENQNRKKSLSLIVRG